MYVNYDSIVYCVNVIMTYQFLSKIIRAISLSGVNNSNKFLIPNTVRHDIQCNKSVFENKNKNILQCTGRYNITQNITSLWYYLPRCSFQIRNKSTDLDNRHTIRNQHNSHEKKYERKFGLLDTCEECIQYLLNLSDKYYKLYRFQPEYDVSKLNWKHVNCKSNIYADSYSVDNNVLGILKTDSKLININWERCLPPVTIKAPNLIRPVIHYIPTKLEKDHNCDKITPISPSGMHVRGYRVTSKKLPKLQPLQVCKQNSVNISIEAPKLPKLIKLDDPHPGRKDDSLETESKEMPMLPSKNNGSKYIQSYPKRPPKLEDPMVKHDGAKVKYQPSKMEWKPRKSEIRTCPNRQNLKQNSCNNVDNASLNTENKELTKLASDSPSLDNPEKKYDIPNIKYDPSPLDLRLKEQEIKKCSTPQQRKTKYDGPKIKYDPSSKIWKPKASIIKYSKPQKLKQNCSFDKNILNIDDVGLKKESKKLSKHPDINDEYISNCPKRTTTEEKPKKRYDGSKKNYELYLKEWKPKKSPTAKYSNTRGLDQYKNNQARVNDKVKTECKELTKFSLKHVNVESIYKYPKFSPILVNPEGKYDGFKTEYEQFLNKQKSKKSATKKQSKPLEYKQNRVGDQNNFINNPPRIADIESESEIKELSKLLSKNLFVKCVPHYPKNASKLLESKKKYDLFNMKCNYAQCKKMYEEDTPKIFEADVIKNNKNYENLKSIVDNTFNKYLQTKLATLNPPKKDDSKQKLHKKNLREQYEKISPNNLCEHNSSKQTWNHKISGKDLCEHSMKMDEIIGYRAEKE